MASRKTETTISEEQKKALMCVVHFKVQLVNHLYTFLVAKDLRIDWKSFTNRMEDSFNQMPEKLKPEHG